MIRPTSHGVPVTPTDTIRRNPLLGLPATSRLQALSPDCRDALAGVLADLAIEADRKAEDSWRRRKGPMAAYWRAVSIYARHTRRALR